ncbi:MAG: hypothetical protein QOJ68_307 [Blastococcus sp.]|jgi:hypothetical protein|nr:hypothetical protein [Blastococcus sp.]
MTSSEPPLRASDDDRTAVVRVLHDAVARGLLTLEECDERVTAAFAARYLHDLPSLTADLPAVAPPAPAAPGWRAVAVLLWLQLRTLLNASTWRGIARSARARPRLAVAVAGLLTVLLLGAMTVGEFGDHGGGPRFEHSHQF